LALGAHRHVLLASVSDGNLGVVAFPVSAMTGEGMQRLGRLAGEKGQRGVKGGFLDKPRLHPVEWIFYNNNNPF